MESEQSSASQEISMSGHVEMADNLVKSDTTVF